MAFSAELVSSLLDRIDLLLFYFKLERLSYDAPLLALLALKLGRDLISLVCSSSASASLPYELLLAEPSENC